MVSPTGSGKTKSGKQPQQPAPVPASSKQAASESETVVNNSLYRISFTNRGAQVKHWALKKFQDDLGKPLDLVNSSAAARYGYPLSLWTYDQALRDKLNSALYVPSGSEPNLSAPATLAFRVFRFGPQRPPDIPLRPQLCNQHRRFCFSERRLRCTRTRPGLLASVTRLLLPRTPRANSNISSTAKPSTWRPRKFLAGDTRHGSFNWAGVSGSYFGAIFIPDNPDNLSVVTLHNAIEVVTDPSKPNETKPADVLGLAVGRPGETTERLFVGPKSLDAAEGVPVPTIIGADKDLARCGEFRLPGRDRASAVAHGDSSVCAGFTALSITGAGPSSCKPLLISVVLLPLRIFQMKSALKMQKAAPQIKAIQEKYKKYSMRDPRKADMNKEIA